RSLNIFCISLCHPRQHLTSRWVKRLKGLSTSGLHPLPTNQHLHWLLLQKSTLHSINSTRRHCGTSYLLSMGHTIVAEITLSLKHIICTMRIPKIVRPLPVKRMYCFVEPDELPSRLAALVKPMRSHSHPLS